MRREKPPAARFVGWRRRCRVAVDRQSIDDLAVAVAERAAVEWEAQLGSTADPEERALLEQLRRVDRIAEAIWLPTELPEILGDFKVLREIGRGGMGVVHEVRQVSLERHVAIKVLFAEMTPDAASLQRFEREARALAALNHPNIVTIHSVEHIDGLHFINMELVDGESLAARIPEGGMPLMQLLNLAIPMADALSSAHARQIIHRDLKPANIMVTVEGRVKILDFGLAKLRSENRIPGSEPIAASIGTTREGAVIGTIPYMSPEQAKGKDLDHRSDLFSFGTVLYEMATGRRAFRGDSATGVISSILHDRVPPVNTVNAKLPDDLSRIIAHCLRKDPEQRYQTAKGLRNELGELRSRLQSEAIRDEHEKAVRRAWWRRALPVSLLVAATVTLAALVFGTAVVDWITIADPAPGRYVVVLPFEFVGEQPLESAFFVAGLNEILTTKLAQLTDTHNLQVAAIPVSGGSPVPTVEDVAALLGVNLVVTGMYQGVGEHVRFTVNLVDPNAGRRLTGRVVNAHLTDTFSLQDDVVAAVIEMLEIELPHIALSVRELHGTDVVEAHRAYVRGRGYLRDYDQIENVDNAIGSFQQALTKDPNYPQAYSGLGMAYCKRFDHDGNPDWVERAFESCAEAVALDDELAEAHICLGTVYLGMGRFGEATAEFGWATSRDATSDEAYRGLARVYERMLDPDAAEEVYRKAILVRPHYWAGYSWLGGFYYRQGRYSEAEKMFRRVIELTPESYRAYSNLGGTLIPQGRFEEAIPVFERSLDIKPNVDGYSNLATSYFKLRRYPDAVLGFQKAVGLVATNYGLWGNLAEAYYWSGQRNKAAQAYRRAVQLALEVLRVNPKDPDVLGELAKYHAMLGDGEEAESYLEQALRLAPADAELKFGAAVIYNQLGQIDTALDWLEKAFEGGISVVNAEDAPEFSNIHGQGRFRELVAKALTEETRAE
jgi:serine/threonine-protein kinase